MQDIIFKTYLSYIWGRFDSKLTLNVNLDIEDLCIS